VDWFHLASDREWWWALMNMIKLFPISQKAGNLFTSYANSVLKDSAPFS
jgi:hypothetical protein